MGIISKNEVYRMYRAKNYRYKKALRGGLRACNNLPQPPKIVVLLINPRRACAARVTVLGLSFRLSVRLSVCLSVTTFSPATRNKTAKKRYQRVQCHTGSILKMAFLVKMLRSKVMA